MRFLCTVAGALALAATTSCIAVKTPAIGVLYTGVKWGEGVTDNAGCSKMGSSQAMAIMGLVAVGDASIKTAMDRGGVTKIHHVDYETMNILGFYGALTTKVYGD